MPDQFWLDCKSAIYNDHHDEKAGCISYSRRVVCALESKCIVLCKTML